jgi:precorrin-6A/cobalt-precorrin-6A reductase
MILVLGGTAESRELVAALVKLGRPIIVSTATAYGGQLLKDFDQAIQRITGRLNEDDLIGLINTHKIKVLIDATHPFAELATAVAQNACARAGITYLRFARATLPLPNHPLVLEVENYQQAACRAVEVAEQTIFVTTGTKTLALFVAAARTAGLRVVARILPEFTGLSLCRDLGLAPADIVAMQGPFGLDLNQALMSHYQADVLVTKESGVTGGADTKIQAALALAIPVVVIKRPVATGRVITDLSELMQQINTYLA